MAWVLRCSALSIFLKGATVLRSLVGVFGFRVGVEREDSGFSVGCWVSARCRLPKGVELKGVQILCLWVAAYCFRFRHVELRSYGFWPAFYNFGGSFKGFLKGVYKEFIM